MTQERPATTTSQGQTCMTGKQIKMVAHELERLANADLPNDLIPAEGAIKNPMNGDIQRIVWDVFNHGNQSVYFEPYLRKIDLKKRNRA